MWRTFDEELLANCRIKFTLDVVESVACSEDTHHSDSNVLLHEDRADTVSDYTTVSPTVCASFHVANGERIASEFMTHLIGFSWICTVHQLVRYESNTIQRPFDFGGWIP